MVAHCKSIVLDAAKFFLFSTHHSSRNCASKALVKGKLCCSICVGEPKQVAGLSPMISFSFNLSTRPLCIFYTLADKAC